MRPQEREAAEALAVRFHETYERLAPSFGYETRVDTRTFDPESKNGRLMVAVCAEIQLAIAADVVRLERMNSELVAEIASHLTALANRDAALSAARAAAIAEYGKDTARMDYLENELYREDCWRDAGCPSGPPRSLFRLNEPITRELVDAAIRALPGGAGET